jgi:hypothetical protein
MKSILGISVTVILMMGCEPKSDSKSQIEKRVEFNQDLADELKRMAETDHIAAYIPQVEYKEWPAKKWSQFKDSVFVSNQTRIQQIFDEHGFVGYDLAGKEGSGHFWLIVQHSDHNPVFQQSVLEKMKIEVEKQNADPSTYGLLVDRVNLNLGKKQVYGTQVDYNSETGQAFAKGLMDSLAVDERRRSIGLPPLAQYLNEMTELHFEMNKAYFTEKCITEPKRYELD